MAATLKPLASGQLTDSETTLYTCPVDTEAVIVSMMLVNTSGDEVADITISVTLSSDQRTLVCIDLGAGYKHQITSKMMLAAGDTVDGLAETGAVIDYLIFGMEKS